MRGFNVTYETTTEESARCGDAADRGFRLIDASLREAIADFYIGYVEADICPVTHKCPPRWFTAYGEQDYCTGERENRSLHLPEHLTPSTRIRIARLVDCYGIKED